MEVVILRFEFGFFSKFGIVVMNEFEREMRRKGSGNFHFLLLL